MSSSGNKNIKIICKDCNKKLYPNAGQFTEEQLHKAKMVKAEFSEEGKMSEHMWVLVKEVTNDNGSLNVKGTLYNEPCELTNIDYGDEVLVSASKIEDTRDTLEPIKTEEEGSDEPHCELCGDNLAFYLDTWQTRFFLCPNCLFDLVGYGLKPQQVKKLRKIHGSVDFYLGEDIYDTKGNNKLDDKEG